MAADPARRHRPVADHRPRLRPGTRDAAQGHDAEPGTVANGRADLGRAIDATVDAAKHAAEYATVDDHADDRTQWPDDSRSSRSRGRSDAVRLEVHHRAADHNRSRPGRTGAVDRPGIGCASGSRIDGHVDVRCGALAVAVRGTLQRWGRSVAGFVLTVTRRGRTRYLGAQRPQRPRWAAIAPAMASFIAPSRAMLGFMLSART